MPEQDHGENDLGWKGILQPKIIQLSARLEEDADPEVQQALPVAVATPTGIGLADEIDRWVEVEFPPYPDLPTGADQPGESGISHAETVIEVDLVSAEPGASLEIESRRGDGVELGDEEEARERRGRSPWSSIQANASPPRRRFWPTVPPSRRETVGR